MQQQESYLAQREESPITLFLKMAFGMNLAMDWHNLQEKSLPGLTTLKSGLKGNLSPSSMTEKIDISN